MPYAGGDAYRCIPYSLLYLERVVRDLNVDVVFIDENTGEDYHQIIKSIKDKIFLVGISAMLGYQIQGGINFSKYVRSVDENIKIVWGGWHVTMMPEQSLTESFIDYVIVGQGESPFRQLVEALLFKNTVDNINGLFYKKDNEIKTAGENNFVSVTQFPDVNYSLIDINKYILQGIPYAKRTVVYFASHGCPHNCTFCALTPVYQQRWFPKPVKDIIKDFLLFKQVAHIDSICFHDDNFFTNRTFSLALAQAMIDNKLDLKWEVWSHAGSFMKMFPEEDLDFFYKAGLRRILCGAESGSNSVLKEINKKLSVEENLNFVKLLKKHKITPYFTTMICFPLDPDEDIKATFEMIRKAKLIDLSLKVHVGYYTPFPNTSFYDKALEKGFIAPHNLEGWISHTFDQFKAPWFKEVYSEKYNIFLNFYVTLSNPLFFNNASRPLKEKTFLAVINLLVFPFAYLRLKLNFFSFPLGAKMFFFFVNRYNKRYNKHFMIYPN